MARYDAEQSACARTRYCKWGRLCGYRLLNCADCEVTLSGDRFRSRYCRYANPCAVLVKRKSEPEPASQLVTVQRCWMTSSSCIYHTNMCHHVHQPGAALYAEWVPVYATPQLSDLAWLVQRPCAISSSVRTLRVPTTASITGPGAVLPYPDLPWSSAVL